MATIKVLNLNFWGIRFISKDVSERLSALIEVLKAPSSDWDFVVLEEVWSDHDYRTIKDSVQSAYPYTYYFYSGVIGSGVCVLSKGQIVSALCHQYSLNGYAHKIQHGDWFGGKVAGLCKIVYKGLRINLYATHVHAEYNRKSDEYLPHRIVQAYELSQFVRHTNHVDDDLNIIAGDFNFEPTDLGYEIICNLNDLKDAWVHRANVDDVDGDTCNTPDNVYSIREDPADKIPRGKRIDYILFGECSGRTSVKCVSCSPVLNKIPKKSICYSDHKGVQAEFLVEQTSEKRAVCQSAPSFEKTFEHSIFILDQGLKNVLMTSNFCYAIVGFLVAILISTIHSDSNSDPLPRWGMMAFRLIIVVIMVWSVLMATVFSRIEKHSLLATKNAMILHRDGEKGTNTNGKAIN